MTGTTPSLQKPAEYAASTSTSGGNGQKIAQNIGSSGSNHAQGAQVNGSRCEHIGTSVATCFAKLSTTNCAGCAAQGNAGTA